jgi:hypothetical protein
MRLVVTNNPKVNSFMSEKRLGGHQCCWVDGFTEDVLRRVRDLCHANYSLITHPLTGSIKPNHTPFKTVVLEHGDRGELHSASVEIAETSLAKAQSLLQSKPRPAAYRNHLEDFAVIDLDFFYSYLDAGMFYRN